MGNFQQHILIIDDNLNNLQVTAKFLKDQGFLISLALDGSSALTLLETITPDLILLDIMMPEMDGIEVCRMIKQRLKDIPIIFLTAKTETEDLIAGFEAGGVDYITKPFNQNELLVRVKTHLELAFSRKKIIELNQTRDKLYSIIAHDIRAPLNNITSTIDAIIKGHLDPSKDSFLEIFRLLESSTKETSNLLNNLLEWTKFQSGSIVTTPNNNKIYPLFIEGVQLYKSAAQDKEITIKIDVSENLEAYFDVVTMHAVFRNLISNAIKFTPEKGTILLTAEIKENMLVASVHDSGVGMSPETIHKIFQKKEHYTSLGTKNEHGTGFGLVIINDFVEKNNGKLEVISKVDGGTTFSVSIPLE